MKKFIFLVAVIYITGIYADSKIGEVYMETTNALIDASNVIENDEFYIMTFDRIEEVVKKYYHPYTVDILDEESEMYQEVLIRKCTAIFPFFCFSDQPEIEIIERIEQQICITVTGNSPMYGENTRIFMTYFSEADKYFYLASNFIYEGLEDYNIFEDTPDKIKIYPGDSCVFADSDSLYE